ncbi:MAG TPA: ABC transporter permease, partial [Candidatus Sulfopaludibacter sp.]|nr:ABC transporter permease [Candidatus Sulfopaludibacter sp.]
MWERIGVILRKELIQALRDPRMRLLLFLPPVIQLLVFGFAVNLDVDHVRIAWMDMDRTPLSRELRERFTGSGRFDIVALPESELDVQKVLDTSSAEAVVRVLPGFERDIRRGRPEAVQVLLDGTNSNTASLVSSYAASIVAGFSGAVMGERQNVRILTRSPNSAVNLAAPQVRAETRVWFNPDLHSRNYFVPGVVANIIFMVTLMLTALAIVREKEIGTMEQLMVTPMRPLELMLGKTLPFAAVGLVDVVLITSVALLVFHIPFRGNPLLLLFCSAVFLMSSLGAGLFLSTISHTQQQAMMANFFFTTPAFMLSGFAFPIRNMPMAVQYLTYLNPMRYFIEIVRGIFLKGVGLAVL